MLVYTLSFENLNRVSNFAKNNKKIIYEKDNI